MLWIPLSLLIALMFAIGNISISMIAHYQFRARYLQAPGATLGNLIPSIILSFYERFSISSEKSLENPELDPEPNNEIETVNHTYYNWFRELYFKEPLINDFEGKKTIHWERVFVSIVLVLLSMFQIWFFFESYYYASLARLNNGIIMALYSLKPIYTSILFYIVFKQKLQKFEFFGIGL